jgi:hypothetical protein
VIARQHYRLLDFQVPLTSALDHRLRKFVTRIEISGRKRFMQ